MPAGPAPDNGNDASSMTYKIALYGFGSFPVVYRHLIELARAEGSSIEFCMILTGPHWRHVVRDVLSSGEILDVYKKLPCEPVGGDISMLSNYSGSLVEDLAALKRAYRRRSGAWLHARGIDFHRLYREFLIDRGATHLLMSNVETPDAKIAVAAAQELGVHVIAPIDLRNLSGTYFSTDSYETPPTYAEATQAARSRAFEFIRDFRHRALPARSLPSDESRVHGDEILKSYLPSFGQRANGFLKIALERPDLFDSEAIRVSLMRNFGLIRGAVRGFRKWQNEKQYDLEDVGSLPKRFIFFPLQYTPEASINVPAPYFVDQFRVIDALRFSMPNDCTLVVKEHPACVEMRPLSFVRRLRRLPGLMVAKSTISSIDLIQRAALTATVTGTAAFEAFLLGRPAIALGRGLAAWALNGSTELGSLPERMLTAMLQPVSDEFLVDRIAKLISVRYPFYFATAHMPGEPMLRQGNIQRFWEAIVDHLARESTEPQRIKRN